MRANLVALVAATAVACSSAAPLQLNDPGLTSSAPSTSVERDIYPRSHAPFKQIGQFSLSDYIVSGQAVCGTAPFDSGLEYQVHIGRDFVNGQGCDAVYATMREHISNANKSEILKREEYKCTGDGYGQTMLMFKVYGATYDTPELLYEVIEGLDQAYPGVPFIAERICLSDGVLASPAWSCAGRTCLPQNTRRQDTRQSSPARRDEVNPWGQQWAPARMPVTAEDPLHMFVAETTFSGVVGYELQINRPYELHTVCEYFLGTLQQAAEINEWGCRADPFGGTQLKFTARLPSYDLCQPGVYDKINQAFPDVGILEKRPGWSGDCEVPSYWPHSTYPSTPIIPRGTFS
ncbi:uncharacterized protein MYCFIDRAFT_84793 [Pseudocercospora fijiensis CIRAD86]|uniref:Uncharacterized protein n=1 Tax=Pseudocercospora fijiensis (strain CIRAD86) TaxID=383855 RepID=M3AJN6_PSEFD|nr:uncharacterized protein MYCFIDRAFT_84793 [Pseudocercospora fijiensis CIRAD86]EME77682.1 hypothetical protein MYCFIDRAFT_84793 [Pseudocercospora fijiensis CIRAD86]